MTVRYLDDENCEVKEMVFLKIVWLVFDSFEELRGMNHVEVVFSLMVE